MNRFVRPAFGVICLMGFLLTVSACESRFGSAGWDAEAVRAQPNAGGPFDRTLQKGYADLALSEEGKGDWEDGRVYLLRAKAAAAGERPAPDLPAARDLPEGALPIAEKARASLMAAFEQGGRVLAPEDSARAQLAFDCWLEEWEENLPSQAEDRAACKAGFESALASVQSALTSDAVVLLPDLDGGVGEVSVTPRLGGGKGASVVLNRMNEATVVGGRVEKPFTVDDQDVKEVWGKALNAQPVPPKHFLLYFLQGRAVLTEKSEKTLPSVLEDAKRRAVSEIEVLGHTDTVGSAPLNARLSERRARAIKDTLVGLGVPPDSVSVRGFGESMPLIPTGNNVDEPQNRRVEVIVR